MNTIQLTPGCKYWCYWLHRFLMFKEKNPDGLYVFEDFGDELFCLTENQVNDLVIRN